MKIGPIQIQASRANFLKLIVGGIALVVAAILLINFYFLPYLEERREQIRQAKLYTYNMPECDERLVQAVVDGRIEEIKKLLDSGAFVNCVACEVYALGEKCNDCNDCRNPDLDGATPLMLAVLGGNVDVVTFLIDRGAEPNAYRPFNIKTALDDAVRRNRPDLVKLLVDAGADVNIKYPRGGLPPLTWAIYEGNIDIIRQLINYGADSNAQVGNEKAPLYVAALVSSPEIVALLLEHGADPNWLSPDSNQTPLIASATGHDLNVYSTTSCRTEVARLLLRKGAININHRRRLDGYTALMCAIAHMKNPEQECKRQCINFAKLLLEAGADPNTGYCHRNKDPKTQKSVGGKFGTKNVSTPLMIARKKGCEEMVELLKAYGAKE